MASGLRGLGKSSWTCFLSAIVLGALSAAPASADYAEAKRHFDSLSFEEQVELTLGLIGTGDFVGLINFGFTKRYYRSVLAFEMRERLTADGILEPREADRLKRAAEPFFSALGAEWRAHPFAGSKLFVPLGLFDREQRTEHGYSFERDDRNLSLSFVGYTNSDKSFTTLYEQLTSDTASRRVAYRRVRDNYFVANGTFRGRNFYTWMSAVPGGSTGFTLAWSDGWESMGSRLSILLANAFIAQAGNTPEPAAPPIGESDAAREPPSPPSSPAAPSLSTGTGFRVSTEGHVLTNYHVAGECKTLVLRKPGQIPVEAQIVAGDPANDLALVKPTASLNLTGTVAEFRSGAPPKAGTEVVVFGFPLSDLLAAGGNIVTGNITALAGLGNDSRQYQISAPVQPGNSGGPVIDRQGRVVGVVVSKLDALKAVARSGDIPQNINFAIKGSVATTFLDGVGVSYQSRDSGADLDTPTTADLAQGFTFLIECRN